MVGSVDSRLDPTLTGPDRLLSILAPVLSEACEPLVASSTGNLRILKLPLFLALPEPRPGFDLPDVTRLKEGVAKLALPVRLDPVVTAVQGHAAGLSLVAQAVEQIKQGIIEACLVAGVDSYFAPATIAWLEQHRQLACAQIRSGFVPGEGAGACLLMSPRTSRALRLSPQAVVYSAGTAWEANLIKTSSVCVGTGLTAAIRRVVEPLTPGTQIHEVICDINGERYRAEEWGFVSLQTWKIFEDPSAFRSPADIWGDMGAASGPLFAMLACQAALRGYNRGPTTMIWTSSEGGLRSAAVLGLTTSLQTASAV